MACFLSTRSQNTEFWPILLKKKKEENLPFLTKKHVLTPLEKCKFSTFLNGCFYTLKWLVFYIKGYRKLSFGLFC